MLKLSLVVVLAGGSSISGVGLAVAGGAGAEDRSLISTPSTPTEGCDVVSASQIQVPSETTEHETPEEPLERQQNNRFAWPVCTTKHAGFGYRVDEFARRVAFHTGEDFKGPLGAPVRAAAKGRVVAAEVRGPFGLMIEVDHGSGLRTRYAHLQSVSVTLGDMIGRGQVIAKLGSSGRVSGPHLHFEIWLYNVVRDPQNYLEQDAACSR